MNDWMDVARIQVALSCDEWLDGCSYPDGYGVVWQVYLKDHHVSGWYLWGLSPWWLVERFVGHCMKWVTSVFGLSDCWLLERLVWWFVGRWMKWASRLVCHWPWSSSMVSGRFQLHLNPLLQPSLLTPHLFFLPFLPFFKTFFLPFCCCIVWLCCNCIRNWLPDRHSSKVQSVSLYDKVQLVSPSHRLPYPTVPHLIPALP